MRLARYRLCTSRSGKKVGRREDLPNIQVSCLRRIRQSDPGVSFSLLVQKMLQDGFGIDPDEFFPQDAIQQVHVAGGQDYVLAGKTMFWRARLCSGGQGLCPGGQGYVLAGKAYVLAGKAMSWRTRTMSWRARLMSWRARLCPGGQGYVLAGKAMSWRARLCPGGQGYVLAGKAMSWRARLCPGGQGYVLADKTMSWRTRSFPGKHEPRFRSRFTADARYVQYGFRRRLQTRRTLPFGSMTAISK